MKTRTSILLFIAILILSGLLIYSSFNYLVSLDYSSFKNDIKYWLPKSAMKNNWSLKLPTPSNINQIFSIDFQDGEDLSIWYYEKEKVPSIKKQMYEMDVEYVDEVLKAYYDELSDDEKLLYNSYIEKEKMLDVSNYYLLLTRKYLDELDKSKVYRNPVNFDKDDHFLLLILDLNEDTLFSFEVIQ